MTVPKSNLLGSGDRESGVKEMINIEILDRGEKEHCYVVIDDLDLEK